ncbi:MAG: hypothetical protein IKJ13_03070 [Clostridia bacterium]|nr:hypothetical protein [Clostridia bacterium]
MKQKFYKKLWFKITCGVVGALLLILLIVKGGIELVAATYSVWSPDYDMIDIDPILEKETLTDDDYKILFEQTGITKIGIDDMLSKGLENQIKRIQRDFFKEPDFECNQFHFCVGMFVNKDYRVIPHVPLQDGDIIYSPSTYISFIDISHAAIVINDGKEVVEAFGYGNPTQISSASRFFRYAEFVVLRPKAGSELGEKVAEYVKNNMLDIPYDILTGILGPKAPDPLKTTHCSHLPWYAYNKFGVDVDSNGGKIVTPADILYSDELEIVQVFGMNVNEFK